MLVMLNPGIGSLFAAPAGGLAPAATAVNALGLDLLPKSAAPGAGGVRCWLVNCGL